MSNGPIILFGLVAVGIVGALLIVNYVDFSDPQLDQRVLIKSVDPNNSPCQYSGATGVVVSITNFPTGKIFIVEFDTAQDGVNTAGFTEGCLLFL